MRWPWYEWKTNFLVCLPDCSQYSIRYSEFLVDAYAEKKIDSRYIRNALKKTELELDISGIDISFSGCTFLGMIIFENYLFSISVGDSRAFMGHGITTSELNVMHKPDYPHERARIENSGGIIHPL